VKKILSTKSRNALLQLGLYQFVGGVIGAVACVLLVIRIGNVNGLVVLGGIIDFNLNLLSIYAGICCIRTRSNAINLSFITQALQIFGFHVGSYGFLFYSGFGLLVGFDLSGITDYIFDYGIADFNFSYNSRPDVFTITINIFAVLLVIWIGRIQKRIAEDIEVRKKVGLA
jgi:hypothetical protein